MAEQLQQSSSPSNEAIDHEEYIHDGRLKIVIAGLDQNIRAQATEVADRRLNQETGEKSGLRGWIKNNVWKKGLARRHYETNYRHAAQKEIVESGNLYHHEANVDAKDYARGTTLRLMHDFTSEELGEDRREIHGSDAASEKDYQLQRGIFQLVEKFAAGELDKENFEEAKKRLFKDMVEQGLDQGALGGGLLTADNLLQIAQNVKTMVAHRQATGEGGIDDIWKDTDIVIGTTKLGARTEIHQSRTDRMVEKLEQKGRSSDFIDESMIGVAAVSALTVGAMAARKPLMAVTAGAASGVFAGVRTNNLIKRARTMDARAATVGKHGAELFDESRYDTVAATDMIQAIGGLYDEGGTIRVGSSAAYEAAMQVLAEVEARRNLSDSRGIDLISFSSLKNVEQERFDLDLAIAKAKADIRRETGFTSFDASYRQSQEGILNQEMIQQKDRIFNKMKRRQVAKSVAIATVLGMATAGVGVGSQMASDLLSDQAIGDISAPASLSPDVFASPNGPIELSGDMRSVMLGDYAEVKLPVEFTVETNADNTLTISGPDGMKLDGLTLNDEGQLTAQSQETLQTAGITIGVESGVVSESVEQSVQMNGKEFVQQHEGLTTEIDRVAWYDNGTSGVAEGSELTLHEPVRDSEGNIHIPLGDLDMTAVSSTGEQVNLQDAALNGDVKIAVTASGDTQANAFLFDVDDIVVDANGNIEKADAIIPHDHPAASGLFDSNGEFKGAFMEGVIDNGVGDDGATNVDIFATAVGPDADDFTDTVVDLQHHKVDSYMLDFDNSAAAAEQGVDTTAYSGPHFIPFITSANLLRDKTREQGSQEPGRREAEPNSLQTVPRSEAIRQMEGLKIGQMFKAELNVHQGWLRSIGPPIGNTYIFARVDQAGKQLPGRPAFYFLTEQQVLDRLQQGRLQHQ